VVIPGVGDIFPMSCYSGPNSMVVGKLEDISNPTNLEFELYSFRHAFVNGFTKGNNNNLDKQT